MGETLRLVRGKIPQTLKKMRIQSHLSIRELSVRSGLGISTISRYEDPAYRGHGMVELHQLANACGYGLRLTGDEIEGDAAVLVSDWLACGKSLGCPVRVSGTDMATAIELLRTYELGHLQRLVRVFLVNSNKAKNLTQFAKALATIGQLSDGELPDIDAHS